eukprot:4924005-Amphidinium_carterae.2
MMQPWLWAAASLVVLLLLVALWMSHAAAHSKGDKSHFSVQDTHSIFSTSYATEWAASTLLVLILPAIKAGGRRIATHTSSRRRRARCKYFQSLQESDTLDPQSVHCSHAREPLPLHPQHSSTCSRSRSTSPHTMRPADGRSTSPSHSDPGDGLPFSRRRRGPSSAHAKNRRSQSVPTKYDGEPALQPAFTSLPSPSSSRSTSQRPADGRSNFTEHGVSVDTPVLRQRKRGTSLPHTRNRRAQAVPKPQPLTVPVIRLPQPFNDAFEEAPLEEGTTQSSRSHSPFVRGFRDEAGTINSHPQRRRVRPISPGPDEMPRVQYRAAIRRNTSKLQAELKARAHLNFLMHSQKALNVSSQVTPEDQEQANSSKGDEDNQEQANCSTETSPKEQANCSTEEQAYSSKKGRIRQEPADSSTGGVGLGSSYQQHPFQQRPSATPYVFRHQMSSTSPSIPHQHPATYSMHSTRQSTPVQQRPSATPFIHSSSFVSPTSTTTSPTTSSADEDPLHLHDDHCGQQWASQRHTVDTRQCSPSASPQHQFVTPPYPGSIPVTAAS